MESKVSEVPQAPRVLLAQALTRATEATQEPLADLVNLVQVVTLGPQEALDYLALQDSKVKGVKLGSVELQDIQATRENLDLLGNEDQRGSQALLAGRDFLV